MMIGKANMDRVTSEMVLVTGHSQSSRSTGYTGYWTHERVGYEIQPKRNIQEGVGAA